MDTDDEDELNELIDAYLLGQALNGDNQHETLPDKSDADIDTVVASIIMTLALVGSAAIAVIVLYLLYRLVKFIRKKYNEKPSQNIIISKDERMKRRMKAMQRFESGSSCHDGEYHQLIPSHQTRDNSLLRQRTTAQPSQTHQQTKSNNKLDRLIHNNSEEMFKREDGITSKGRGDAVVETVVPNESRARTQQAIANIMKKRDPITAMIGKRATHFERSQQQQQQQQQQMDDNGDEDEEEDLGLFSGDYGSSGSTPQAPRRRYEEVRNDRTDAIGAAIIRVMRERRTQTHNQLEQYVQSRVRRINPQPREVMHVIETLICRGYLERNAGASQHLDLSEYRWITLS